MTEQEIKRLEAIEARINEICLENGLLTTKINFEIVTAEKMIEAMSYRLPVNFSHWSFGRNYEKEVTRYRHSGHGIPYEVVWNFDNPTALLVDTNPFGLNVLILAHVFGHVDFNLANMLMKRGRNVADVIFDAKAAKRRFEEYEKLYGIEAVEEVIEAAIAWQYHQDPDPFAEDLSEEEVRQRKISAIDNEIIELNNEIANMTNGEQIRDAQRKKIELKARKNAMERKTPPVPEYDILKYILEKSPKAQKPWIHDVITVVREQMRALAPNFRTKLINEGWATYWHTLILRQLAQEGLITNGEREEAITFHAKVTRKHRAGFNVYSIGPAFWQMIRERWDRGMFGKEWESCTNRDERENWDKKTGKGLKKILELRRMLSDVRALESFFYDEFIHDQQIYLWESEYDWETGEEVYRIKETDPKIIRMILKRQHSNFGIPTVSIRNGNHKGAGELVLQHTFSGFELDEKMENGALEKLYFLWGRPVHLVTYENLGYDKDTKMFRLKRLIHSYDGRSHSIFELKK